MDKLKLFHTYEELKDYQGTSILFLCRANYKLYEASWCGYDHSTKTQMFEHDGIVINPRNIWLWCDRYELFKKTNLLDLEDDEKKVEQENEGNITNPLHNNEAVIAVNEVVKTINRFESCFIEQLEKIDKSDLDKFYKPILCEALRSLVGRVDELNFTIRGKLFDVRQKIENE